MALQSKEKQEIINMALKNDITAVRGMKCKWIGTCQSQLPYRLHGYALMGIIPSSFSTISTSAA